MDFEIGANIIPFPVAKADGPVISPTSEGHVDTVGPIEREMRAKLAKLKGCKYPDTFDWSVYDRIAQKFETPPRGGVVFNTTFKLATWHATCTKCLYSFEIDTYGRGCFHNCVYCYAKDQLTSHGYWNNPQPFPVNLADVRRAFYTVFETDRPHKFREALASRVPLRIGSMSDSFMWQDTKYGVTKELLRILSHYEYPHIIFTRSDLAAHDDYLSVMNPRLTAIQYSISGNNWKVIRKLEPGAPSYLRRITAIAKLSKQGFNVAVRVNPLFPKFPDGYYSDPDSVRLRFGKDVPCIEMYDENFVSEVAAAGARTLLVGFVRLSGTAISQVSKALQFDMRPFFTEALRAKKGFEENRFTDSEISHYYLQFKKACDKSGLRFSTCYIGNGVKDYFQYQHLWANKLDCCDAIGNVNGFKNSCQSLPDSYVQSFNPARKNKVEAPSEVH